MYRNTISYKLYILIFTVGVFLYGHNTVLAQSDEDVFLEGWFSIIWGDGLPGTGETHEIYTLTTPEKETLRLFIDEELARSAGGVLSLDRKFVAVQGNMPAQKSSGDNVPSIHVASINVISMDQFGEEVMAEDEFPGVSGSKPWVTIMCKFADYSAEPKDLAYFTGMYSNAKPGLDHYWREVSYNTVNIAGSNAYGWFTLPQNEIYYNPTDTKGGTNLTSLYNDCVAAADPTVNFSSYSGINMMFNTNFDNGYAWGGSRYDTLDGVTKSFSVTWEPPWGYSDITVIAHEMGHGFGLPHSSGMYGATYDNEWDVMSDSWANCGNSRDATYGCLGQHTIAYHKDRLGWIPAGQKLTTDGTNTTLTLDNLAILSTPNYRMITIPVNGSSTHYYTVEVRQKNGYDIKLPGKAVIIHEVNTTRSRPANVVDIDGDGDTGDEGAMWTVGETYANTDHDFSVEVLAETTNGFIVEVQFPGPDLVVESPSVSDQSLNPNEAFTLSAIVRNQGASQADGSTLRYYRSTDSTITTGDTQIGTDPISTLLQDQTSNQSLAATAPSAPGTYYFGACVDSVSNESSTTNNCSAGVMVSVSVPGEPDLVVQSPSVSDVTPETGQAITLSATVRNQGDNQANSTTLRYFRSTDSTITLADTQIGTDAVATLAVNSTSPESLNFNAPASTGTYYYGACVDSVSGESQTTNNCSAAIAVTVVESGEPDLVVQALSISDSSPLTQQSITLSTTVRNQGTVQANSSTLRYFRSTNTTISTGDTQIGTDHVVSLTQNSTSPESFTFNAPATPGTYYYGACVNSVSGESQTTNNCSGAVTVTVSSPGEPDLTVQSLSVSNSSPVVGQTISLSATIRNQGTLQASSTTLRYYRSLNTTISTSDIEIGSDTVPSLGEGSSATESLSFSAPDDSGIYYYGVCVAHVNNEAQTSNNCSNALTVTVAETPDTEFPWFLFLQTIQNAGAN